MVCKRLIWVWGLVILSLFVFSASFNHIQWVNSGEPIFDIYFSINSDDGVYISDIDGNFKYLNEDRCGSLNDYYVCVEEIKDSEEGYIAKVSISEYLYDFEIKRTFDSDEFFLNDEVLVNVTVSNIGKKDGLNLIYTDQFPVEIDVDSIEDGKVIDNSFIFDFDLESNEEINFSYKLRAIDFFRAKLKAKLDIDNNYFYSGLKEFAVKDSVSLFSNLSNYSCLVGETLNLNNTVFNHVNSSSLVEVTINLPNNLQFVDGTRSKVQNFSFDNLTNKSIDETLLCVYSGKSEIQFTGSISNGVNYENDFDSVKLDVDKLDFEFSSNIVSNYFVGSTNFLYALFENKNDKNMSDVVFEVNSNLLENKTMRIEEIKINESISVLDDDFLFPLMSGNYYINISYYYFTSFGEKINFTKSFKIILSDAKQIIIKQSMPRKVEAYERFNVSLVLNNPMSTKIKNVEVFDTFDDFSLVEGKNNADIVLDSKEEKSIYRYEVQAPLVFEKESFPIKTMVTYEYANETVSFDKTFFITVEPSKEEIRDYKIDFKLTIKKDDAIGLGDVINVDATVENEDDISFKKLVLRFPESSDYEVLSKTEQVLDGIDPGELVYYDDLFKIRPSRSGNYKISDLVFDFIDEFGISHREKLSFPEFKVEENNSIEKPLLKINQTFLGFFNNSAKFAVEIFNIGSLSTKLNLSYTNGDKDFFVSSESSEVFIYEVKLPSNGEFFIKPLRIIYDNGIELAYITYPSFKLFFDSYVELSGNDGFVNDNILVNDDEIVYVDELNENSSKVNSERQRVGFSNFISDNFIVIVSILLTIILIIILVYEIKKHKL